MVKSYKGGRVGAKVGSFDEVPAVAVDALAHGGEAHREGLARDPGVDADAVHFNIVASGTEVPQRDGRDPNLLEVRDFRDIYDSADFAVAEDDEHAVKVADEGFAIVRDLALRHLQVVLCVEGEEGFQEALGGRYRGAVVERDSFVTVHSEVFYIARRNKL